MRTVNIGSGKRVLDLGYSHSYEADVVKPLTCFFSRESRVEAQGHFALRRSSLPLNPRFLTIVLGRDLRAGLAHKSFSYFFFLERFPPET
jgi:hypothetical protein